MFLEKESDKERTHVFCPNDFFSYIDAFPLLSQQEKESHKLLLLEKTNRHLFTLDTLLYPETFSSLKNEFLNVSGDHDISWLVSKVDKEG